MCKSGCRCSKPYHSADGEADITPSLGGVPTVSMYVRMHASLDGLPVSTAGNHLKNAEKWQSSCSSSLGVQAGGANHSPLRAKQNASCLIF